jgi:hypothetical protein
MQIQHQNYLPSKHNNSSPQQEKHDKIHQFIRNM